MGKSALVGRWMRSLDHRLFYPLCLTQATLSASAILATLAGKLGKPAAFSRERNLRLIEQALEQLERRILVLILDEAQNTSPVQNGIQNSSMPQVFSRYVPTDGTTPSARM